MNRYLEKIAESVKDEKKRAGVGALLGSMLGGTVVGHMATTPLAQHSGRKILDNIESRESSADLHTVRKFMRDNKLKTTFNQRESFIDKRHPSGTLPNQVAKAMRFTSSPAYEGISDTVAGVRRPRGGAINHDVIMHELGHAKDFASNRKIKLAESILARHPATKLITTVGTGTALYNKDTRDYAPAVAAVPGLLTLRQEVAANYHAYKGVKAHKGVMPANKFLKGTVKTNLLNYAAVASAPVIGAYVAGKILDKVEEKK